MPLPIPKKDENKDKFLSRCAGNDKMNEEYPDSDQRIAVCSNIYDNKDKMERIMFSVVIGEMPSERMIAHFRDNGDTTYNWDVEIFATGKWNGYQFSDSDLDKMVESFSELHKGGYLDSPLKFGHNDEQQMTDGYPALGWIDKLYTKKDEKGRYKLWASFTDVPKIVYEAAKKKMYRKVSIELEFDVKHKGTMYPYVITGVALLGADLPAVNTLADLSAYMGRDPLIASKKMAFSAVLENNHEEEKPKMAEIDDKELEELRAQAAKAVKATDDLKEFKRQEAEAKVKLSRDSVNKHLDKLVEDMRISPAQRAAFAKTLRVDDDEAVTKIEVADIDALLPEESKYDKGDNKTFNRKKGEENEVNDTDDFLDTEAKKLIAESGGKMKYSRALEKVMAANPEIAKQHVIESHEKEDE